MRTNYAREAGDIPHINVTDVSGVSYSGRELETESDGQPIVGQ